MLPDDLHGDHCISAGRRAAKRAARPFQASVASARPRALKGGLVQSRASLSASSCCRFAA